MMTNNLENLLAMVPLSCATAFGQLRVVTVKNHVRYLCGDFNRFPSQRTASLTTTAENAGISIGTGGTEATREDYQLEETITSGVSLSLTSATPCMVDRGSSVKHPAIVYKITVTNTGAEELTVREIGYKQQVKVVGTPGDSTTADNVLLLDRTVLETPVTIQPGDAGVIAYTLYTYVRGRGSQSGVTLVDFTYGSDEAVAAMIVAARAGTIDLQANGGWRVGDCRTIHVGAWTGGGDTAHAAQDIDIVIAQFGDYNDCGSVLQFDLLLKTADGQRMDSVGGVSYGETEMFTTSLPALVEALPAWLQTLLLEFDVKVGVPRSEEVETVAHNKLALRSLSELNPNASNYSSYGRSGEGTQAAVYANDSSRLTRGTNTAWTRSPAKGSSSSSYVYLSYASTSGTQGPTYALSFFAFGCL